MFKTLELDQLCLCLIIFIIYRYKTIVSQLGKLTFSSESMTLSLNLLLDQNNCLTKIITEITKKPKNQLKTNYKYLFLNEITLTQTIYDKNKRGQ